MQRRQYFSLRRDPRQNQLNRCTDARFAGQLEATAELFHDDRVHDVQTKPRRAVAAPRGEEWVERLTLYLRRHSAAVVCKDQLQVIGIYGTYPDVDAAFLIVGKSVCRALVTRLIRTCPNGPGKLLSSRAGSRRSFSAMPRFLSSRPK